MKKKLLLLTLLASAFIANAQNVGIGTTTPLTNLHIRNGVSGVTPFPSSLLAVESNVNTYINLLSPAVNETAILFGQPGSAANGVIMYNNPSTPNGFQFRNNGNLTRMTIANNGNIGIGTGTPFSPLTFNNNLGEKISLYGSASESYGLGIQNGLLQIHSDAAGADIAFGYRSSSAFTENMRIKGNGNVGIGTSIPSATAALDVSSTTKGFLPPRMTKAQGAAISNPVPGLMIWCSNCGATGELNVYNGTAWTNMIGNPTSPAQTPPTVITTAISGINSTTAVSGGNVTSDGYSAVTVRGVCWDIATNPTVALSTKTNNGTGTGIFESNITGLTLGITYYVRAYATNAIGTSYGAEFSFTTVFGPGDSYQGGIVAYILQPGDPGYIAGQTHGLIAAASNQSTAAEWGCGGIAIPGADGTALGTGNQNTIDIMAGCATAGIAARLCGDLVLNGYSDWYLPSMDELNKLYINRVAVGGFGTGYYWSSSESDNINAREQNFYSGYIGVDGKIYSKGVRAVRAF